METQDGLSQDRVKLVASTGDITTGYSPSSEAKNGQGSPGSRDEILGYFESVQWTADGTTLLTYSSTNLVSGYLVPADLLSAGDELALKPQACISFPNQAMYYQGRHTSPSPSLGRNSC